MPLFRVRQPLANTIAIGTRDFGDGEVVELTREAAAQIRRSCGVASLEPADSIEQAEGLTAAEERKAARDLEIEQSLRNPLPQKLINLATLDRETTLATARLMGSAAATLKAARKYLEMRPREEVTRAVEALRADAVEATG